jgi:hypothetical protein
MNKVNRVLICRKIESLFDKTPNIEKISESYCDDGIKFNYNQTLIKNEEIEIEVQSSRIDESDILYRICMWLQNRNISHYKMYDGRKSFLCIHYDSLDRFIKLIKPYEFDYLWDGVSDKAKELINVNN